MAFRMVFTKVSSVCSYLIDVATINSILILKLNYKNSGIL